MGQATPNSRRQPAKWAGCCCPVRADAPGRCVPGHLHAPTKHDPCPSSAGLAPKKTVLCASASTMRIGDAPNKPFELTSPLSPEQFIPPSSQPAHRRHGRAANQLRHIFSGQSQNIEQSFFTNCFQFTGHRRSVLQGCKLVPDICQSSFIAN